MLLAYAKGVATEAGRNREKAIGRRCKSPSFPTTRNSKVFRVRCALAVLTENSHEQRKLATTAVDTRMNCGSQETQVFVVGGGPAGLAAAIAARRAGFSVTLADAARPPIDKTCGEGIMPDGLAALRKLGIVLPADKTVPFRGIRFSSTSAAVAAEFPKAWGSGCAAPPSTTF